MNDAGRIGFVQKGDYSSSATYDFLDVVYYNGASYVAKKLTTGNTPEHDNEYWHILADANLLTGVKGNNETAYRTGQVNLTAENIGAFPGSIEIPNNGDLNDYTEPGIYWSNIGNTILNKPDGVDAFSLVVIKTSAGYREHFLIRYYDGIIHNRIKNASSWNPWIELPKGIKGNRETTYRGGNVNLTPDNIGAVPWFNSTIVGANTNWDTITAVGSYKVQNATMDAAHHAPVDVYKFGTLLVIWAELSGQGDARKIQIYIPDFTNAPLAPTLTTRTFNNNTWREWGYIYDSVRNDATYVKKTGDTMSGELVIQQTNKGFAARNTDNTHSIWLGVDTVNNRGLWDKVLNKMFAYLDTQNAFNLDAKTRINEVAEFKRSTGQGTYLGTVGTGGWVVIAEIKIKAGLMNYTLEFEIGGRGRILGTVLGILFLSTESTDPGLNQFYYYGGPGNIFRLKKTATSTWQLAAQKSENYGEIYVMRVHSQNEFKSINYMKITYPNTQLTTAPDSTWIAPTLGGEIGTAAVANSLSSSSSLKYKKNISDMSDEEARKLLELRPIKYDYIDEEKGTDCYGFVAEEVAEIMDYPVVYKDGEPDALDLSKFVPYQTKMIQILSEEVKELREMVLSRI